MSHPLLLSKPREIHFFTTKHANDKECSQLERTPLLDGPSPKAFLLVVWEVLLEPGGDALPSFWC